MSLPLLQRVETFLQEQDLIGDYTVKFFSWTDADITAKSGQFICIKMAGTSGARDEIVQRPDVRLLIVGAPGKTKEPDAKAKEIYEAFAGIEKTAGILKFDPLSVVQGGFELENKRWAFELIVRCFVQDY
jgi:hypothetical protein